MVQRNSQPVAYGSGSTAQLQGTNIGGVNPVQPQGSPEGALGTVLNALLPVADKLSQQAFQKDLEGQYLSGISDAATMKSEAEIEGDPLTRDWRVAGYRDTVGKLAYASEAAKIHEEMPVLRGKSPEEFKTRLNERREALLPQLNGMSADARKSMLTQFATADVSDIAKHSVEHQKYIIEQETAALQASTKAAVLMLNTNKSSGDEAVAASTANFGVHVQGILNSAQLRNRPDIKSSLITEAASYALSEDHLPTYNLLTQDKIKQPDGTLLDNPLAAQVRSTLKPEDLEKLQVDERSAAARTRDVRSLGSAKEWGLTEAKLKAGETITESQIDDIVNRNVLAGFKSASAAEGLYGLWATSNATKSTSANLVDSYRAGLGGSNPEAKTAFVKAISGLDFNSQIIMWEDAAQHGAQGASEAVGKLYETVVHSVKTTDGPIPKAHTDALVAFNIKATALKAADKGYQVAEMYAGMNPEDAKWFQTFNAKFAVSKNTEDARKAATEEELKNLTLTSNQKAAALSGNKDWDRAKSDLIGTFGMSVPRTVYAYGADFLGVFAPDWVGKGRVAAMDTVVRPSYGEDSEIVVKAVQPANLYLQERVQAAFNADPEISQAKALELAKADLVRATIRIGNYGALVVPDGVPILDVLGGNKSVSSSRYGVALENLYTNDPTLNVPSNVRRITTIDSNGILKFSDYLKDKYTAVPYKTGTISPDTLTQELKDMDDKRASEEKAIHGRGAVHSIQSSSGGTLPLRVHGRNSAGVDNTTMFSLRNTMVDQFKYKGTDANVMQAAFEGFTNAVVREAKQASYTAFNQDSDKYTVLSTSLGFIDPKWSTSSTFKPFVAAVKSGNRQEAIRLLTSTPGYNSKPIKLQTFVSKSLIKAMP